VSQLSYLRIILKHAVYLSPDVFEAIYLAPDDCEPCKYYLPAWAIVNQLNIPILKHVLI
jgi:hypothetical protein